MVALNKSGIPTLLSGMQTLLEGDYWDKRFLLTLLNISRCLDVTVEPNFSSVTNPGVIPKRDLYLRIVRKAKALRISRPHWNDPH
jgi:uncharacterized protein YqgV (UPF0045/DUF77 family)